MKSIAIIKTVLADDASSMIRSFSWEESDECKDVGTLTIDFKTKGNKRYEYYDVPLDVFFTMTRSESKGKFLNSSVKNSYKFEEKK